MADHKPGYGLEVDQTLRTTGVFAQSEWRIGRRWRVLAGLRYDRNHLITNGVLNPRVNALYSLTEHLRVRGSYARGFRSPQVFTEDIHVELVGGEIQAIRLSNELSPETSDAYTLSLDYDKQAGAVDFNVIAEGFYTRLYNIFVLEEVPTGGEFPILEKRNGGAATVAGGNFELKAAIGKAWTVQAGFTAQIAEYDEPVEWSLQAETSETRRFFKAPNTYGNFILTWQPNEHLNLSASGVYTGSMIAQHYAGYIEQDVLEETPAFMELNTRVGYCFHLTGTTELEVSGGVQNIFDSYQNDFDRGSDRDAGYVYGPGRPRTFFIGLAFKYE